MLDPRSFVPRLLRDGRVAVWRPVRPSDAGALEALFMRQSRATRQARFHGAVNGFTPAQLAQMTLPAPPRAALGHALVLATLDAGDPCLQVLLAEARFASEDGRSAEIAIVVDEPCRRQGLARGAIALLSAAARRVGLRSLHGRVLETSEAMLALATRAGWPFERDRDDARVRCYRIDLAPDLCPDARRLNAPATAPAAAVPATNRAARCVR